MTTAILHLSDIHIDTIRHPILRRAEKLANAVASNGYQLDHVIVVVSGDIANAGTKKEYKLSALFFTELSAKLKALAEVTNVDYVFVPGNHDCDLTAASDVRQPDLIEPKLAAIDLNGTFV